MFDSLPFLYVIDAFLDENHLQRSLLFDDVSMSFKTSNDRRIVVLFEANREFDDKFSRDRGKSLSRRSSLERLVNKRVEV